MKSLRIWFELLLTSVQMCYPFYLFVIRYIHTNDVFYVILRRSRVYSFPLLPQRSTTSY